MRAPEFIASLSEVSVAWRPPNLQQVSEVKVALGGTVPFTCDVGPDFRRLLQTCVLNHNPEVCEPPCTELVRELKEHIKKTTPMSWGNFYVVGTVVTLPALLLAPFFLQALLEILLVISLSPFAQSNISAPPPSISYLPSLFYCLLPTYYYRSPYSLCIYLLFPASVGRM